MMKIALAPPAIKIFYNQLLVILSEDVTSSGEASEGVEE
jgi:hypothetical protein